jgi:hypothetical protein
MDHPQGGPVYNDLLQQPPILLDDLSACVAYALRSSPCFADWHFASKDFEHVSAAFGFRPTLC